jgi:hypothetical protein
VNSAGKLSLDDLAAKITEIEAGARVVFTPAPWSRTALVRINPKRPGE